MFQSIILCRHSSIPCTDHLFAQAGDVCVTRTNPTPRGNRAYAFLFACVLALLDKDQSWLIIQIYSFIKSNTKIYWAVCRIYTYPIWHQTSAPRKGWYLWCDTSQMSSFLSITLAGIPLCIHTLDQMSTRSTFAWIYFFIHVSATELYN